MQTPGSLVESFPPNPGNDDMTPLILQIQADAMDANVRIGMLLRKAKVAAVKLGLKEFGKLVDCELSGYTREEDVPEFRIVFGKLKCLNPFHGWMPVSIGDIQIEEIITRIVIQQPITSLEDTYYNQCEAGYVCYPLNGRQQILLAECTGLRTQYQLHIYYPQIFDILEAIRTKVIDWTLSLEQAGVLGEGMQFTTNEKKVATELTKTIINIGNAGTIGNVHGAVGNLTRSTVSANHYEGTADDNLDEIRDLVRQILSQAQNVDPTVRDAASKIDSELRNKTPNKSVIHAGLSTIRTVCEGAAGNLIASGILAALSKIAG